MDFVRDNPSEPVPEETFTHSHLSWSSIIPYLLLQFFTKCLQCFDAVGWVTGRVSSLWWDAGVVIWLGRGADLHMAHLMPLPLTVSCSSKSWLVLPSWFYLSGTCSPG